MQRVLSEPSRPNRTLLIVDDEEFVLSALSRVFRRDGYTVVSATGPLRALDLLIEHDPQVMISDQSMADMTGTELCTLVRDTRPQTRRVLLSAHIDQHSAEHALSCGAVSQVLSKPWNDSQLREIVRAAFNQNSGAPSAAHLLAQNGGQEAPRFCPSSGISSTV